MVTSDADWAYNITMIPSMPELSVAMAGLDPGAIGLGGLAPGGERVLEVIAWVSKSGARGMQIDATAAGIRPRELDRSARRDLAALLRRSELVCSGVDVLIPPEHLCDSATVDRAVATILGAIELAADLAVLASGAVVTRMSGVQACVSLTLPGGEKGATPGVVSARDAVIRHAESRGVRLADCAWPMSESTTDQTLGVGLDPAVALNAGADPVHLAATLGTRLAHARLSDIRQGPGGLRCVPGTSGGRLDLTGYMVALATSGHTRHVVLDVRGVAGVQTAVPEVRSAISRSGLWPID